jgi:hypothetical protein
MPNPLFFNSVECRIQLINQFTVRHLDPAVAGSLLAYIDSISLHKAAEKVSISRATVYSIKTKAV